MKKNSVVILIGLLFIFSFGFALNPVDFVPADIDFAVELSYPKTIMEQTGLEDVILSELSGVEFLNAPIQNAKMVLFGKFGLSDLLIEELDFFGYSDLEDILDSPEMLLSLSTMPVAILTNLINVDVILDFLEGEFMAGALEENVYFISEIIEKKGYETKHLKIRYYGNEPNVFLDLFFVKLEEDYTLFTSNELLLDQSLNSFAHPDNRFQSLQTNDKDGFLRIVNNGVNYSWFLMRMLNIMAGKPVSETLSAGVKDNMIFVDLLMEMTYPPEGEKEILEKTKTDLDHFHYIPDFEEIKVYTSLPQTGLSLKSLLSVFNEITGEFNYDYYLEDTLSIPASFGPEVERYDMYLIGEEMMPYILLKVQDAPFIFNHYCKDNWLESQSTGTISYAFYNNAFYENSYIAYDNRYDYIEVYLLPEDPQERLNRGELYFIDEMAKEKEPTHHIPQNLWGLFMYEDLLSLMMDYDEFGNFKIHMSLSLDAIMNEIAMGQKYEQMQEIVDVYLDMNYAIQDEIYYTPNEIIDIQQMLNTSYLFDYYDEALIQLFNIQTGQKDNALMYYIYYDGPLPEGLMPEDLARQLSDNIYDENVEITVKSGNVILEILQTR